MLPVGLMRVNDTSIVNCLQAERCQGFLEVTPSLETVQPHGFSQDAPPDFASDRQMRPDGIAP